MISILDYALDYKPCLVLTNATDPIRRRLKELAPLLKKPNSLNFRVSIDSSDEKTHDAGRGEGNFAKSLETIGQLFDMGFSISIARQREKNEECEEVDKKYQALLKEVGVMADVRIVSFPDFLTPGSISDTPHITENCMTQYHSEETRNDFMCNFSKMVVKRAGKMRVYACTLVDDDIDYELETSLSKSMKIRVMLKHHRCYSCFAHGASCSEG